MYGSAACKVVVTCSQITKEEFDTLRSQFTELSSRMALTALKSDQLSQEVVSISQSTKEMVQDISGLNTVVESVMNTVDAAVEDMSGLKTFCTALSEAVEIEPVAGEPGPITYPPS